MISKCKAYLFYSEINRPEPLRSSIQIPIPYSCVNSAHWYFCFWLFDLYSYFYHLLCMSRIFLYNNLNTELVKGHNFLLVLLNHTKPRLKLCKTIGFLNVQYSDTIQTPAVDLWWLLYVMAMPTIACFEWCIVFMRFWGSTLYGEHA